MLIKMNKISYYSLKKKRVHFAIINMHCIKDGRKEKSIVSFTILEMIRIFLSACNYVQLLFNERFDER